MDHAVKIQPGGLLEDLQVEIGGSRKQVIENLSLDPFIGAPIRGSGEDIRVDWQASLPRRERPNLERFLFIRINLRTVFQISLDIDSEDPNVRDLRSIQQRIVMVTVLVLIGL